VGPAVIPCQASSLLCQKAGRLAIFSVPGEKSMNEAAFSEGRFLFPGAIFFASQVE
jgi:hypothetical protein